MGLSESELYFVTFSVPLSILFLALAIICFLIHRRGRSQYNFSCTPKHLIDEDGSLMSDVESQGSQCSCYIPAEERVDDIKICNGSGNDKSDFDTITESFME